jgi:hypothetical protein
MNKKLEKMLRPEDKSDLEKVVAAFKKQGFEVIAVGSILTSKKYDDIDLVVRKADVEAQEIKKILEKFETNPSVKVYWDGYYRGDTSGYAGLDYIIKSYAITFSTKIDITFTEPDAEINTKKIKL